MAPDFDRVLDRLRAWRKAAGESYSGLALRAGLSRAALLDMDGGDWSPSGDTIRAIEALIPRGWQAGDAVPGRAGPGEGGVIVEQRDRPCAESGPVAGPRPVQSKTAARTA
jgi:transcriptional regulator with XRE-family HTH domain